jgi:GntR family transcriptional regulator
MPPALRVDPTSIVPVYRQIADTLRGHLVEEVLRPGDLLPPVRQLALDLGVHFNTVAQAYRMLAEEGWLDLRRRRGAMVVRRERPPVPDRRRVDQILKRLSGLAAELRTAGLTQAQVAVALRRLSKGEAP